MFTRKIKNQFFRAWNKIFPSGFVYFGHGVLENFDDPYIQQLHLIKKDFEQVLDFWNQAGFHFITMEELIELVLSGTKVNKPSIHLTFDDGYKNNIEVIYPILKKRKIPFSIYVISDLIDTDQILPTTTLRIAILNTSNQLSFHGFKGYLKGNETRTERIEFCERAIKQYKKLTYPESAEFLDCALSSIPTIGWNRLKSRYKSEQTLSMKDIIKISKDPNVFIGNHGKQHLILSDDQSEELIRMEIEDSTKWLNKNLDQDHKVFAYPNGQQRDFGEKSKSCLRNAGYDLAFTTMPGVISPGMEPLIIPRIFLTKNPCSTAK